MLLVLVYLIRNKNNGLLYIGMTSRTLAKRWAAHLYRARSSSTPLSLAIREHGADAFEITEIEACLSQRDMIRREVFWIAELKAQDRRYGYNVTGGGEGGDTFTDNPNKETARKNMSGRTLTEWHKQQISAAGRKRTGWEMTDEQKAKLSIANKGKVPTFFPCLSGKDHPMFGKKHTAESKVKIKAAGLRRRLSGVPHHSESFKTACRVRWTGKGNPQHKEVPKEVLMSFLRDGKKVDEIATILGVSRPTIISKCKLHFGKTINQLKSSLGLPLLVRKAKL